MSMNPFLFVHFNAAIELLSDIFIKSLECSLIVTSSYIRLLYKYVFYCIMCTLYILRLVFHHFIYITF